jgi:hypothetical protein
VSDGDTRTVPVALTKASAKSLITFLVAGRVVRCCRLCHELKPLDAEHFHHASQSGLSGFSTTCRSCANAQDRGRAADKTPEQRERRNARARELYAAQSPEHLERCRARARENSRVAYAARIAKRRA